MVRGGCRLLRWPAAARACDREMYARPAWFGIRPLRADRARSRPGWANLQHELGLGRPAGPPGAVRYIGFPGLRPTPVIRAQRRLGFCGQRATPNATALAPGLLRPACNAQCHSFGSLDQCRYFGCCTRAAWQSRASHAPYSGSASGFALADGEGRVYAGSYTESAAYNPSLGPVQAAIVAYLAAGGGGGDGGVGEGVVAGVLAEIEGAAVSQEETARIFFSAVAPNARFSVYRLRVSSGSV